MAGRPLTRLRNASKKPKRKLAPSRWGRRTNAGKKRSLKGRDSIDRYHIRASRRPAGWFDDVEPMLRRAKKIGRKKHATKGTIRKAPKPSTRRKNASKPYQGHPSWNHWNVSLWVNNDEGLYREARRTSNKDRFAEWLMDVMPVTPDGAKVSKTTAIHAWRGARE